GDSFLNEEVWLAADEQAISFDRKAALEENGFRIGVMGGAKPVRLQTLLASEKTCNGRRLFVHKDRPATISLGPPVAACRFELMRDGSGTPVQFERAEYALEAVPALVRDASIKLVLTPEIKHGDSRLIPGVAEDHSGWAIREQKPRESYAALRFDIVLGP